MQSVGFRVGYVVGIMRNLFLYKKLVAKFQSVIVSHEGCENEEYRVCCPFCGDSRHRLYINCAWGVYDRATNSSHENLVHCYNEFCVQPDEDEPVTYRERWENRDTLFNAVYRNLSGMAILESPTVEQQKIPGPAEWPGSVIRLDRLAETRPNHPAVKYMEGRGFDPVILGRDFGFMFCDEVSKPEYRMALGTIVMPVWQGDELYSWISRYVGDTVNGVPLAKAGVKKYYNMPGRSLASVGFNLDQVLCYSTIVIVEGILDAIRTGPFATCLFTKTISAALKKQIHKGLQQYQDSVIVVMLDPDQSESERKRGVRHHIERVAEIFRESGSAQVVTVYLPKGRDPGDMSQAEILRAIRKAAQEQQVKLNFKQRKQYVPESSAGRLAGTSAARPGFGEVIANRKCRAAGREARKRQGQNTSNRGSDPGRTPEPDR